MKHFPVLSQGMSENSSKRMYGGKGDKHFPLPEMAQI